MMAQTMSITNIGLTFEDVNDAAHFIFLARRGECPTWPRECRGGQCVDCWRAWLEDNHTERVTAQIELSIFTNDGQPDDFRCKGGLHST